MICALLEAEGIIRRERRAQSVYYSLAAPHAQQLARLLHDAFCAPPRKAGGRKAATRNTSKSPST